MSRRTMFFAVREDLLTVLERVERRVPLTYRLCVHHSLDVPTWESAASIEHLGEAVEGGMINQEQYLVMPSTSPYTPWVRELPDGRTLRGVYPEGNPDSVVLTPAGLYSDSHIVIGEIGVALPKPPGFDLVGALQRAIRAEFVKVYDCYIGPVALELAQTGVRLVGSTRQERKCDLELPKNIGNR